MFSPCSSRPPLTPLPSVLDVTVDVVVEGAVERDVGACVFVSIGSIHMIPASITI